MNLMGKPTHGVRTLAGKEIPVVVAPRFLERNMLVQVLGGVESLLRGMWVTLTYLVRPSTVITEQYPENRDTLRMHERSRARLESSVDENGYHSCTACGACQTSCPNLSIQVLSRKSAAGKREIDHLLWRMDSCSFCNACVQACPSEAIRFTAEFETSVHDRRLLVWNLIPYAGPTAKDLAKIEDPAQRTAMIELRGRYSGPIPLNGEAMAGVTALETGHSPEPEAEAAPEPASEPAAEAKAEADTTTKTDAQASTDADVTAPVKEEVSCSS